MPQHTNKLSRAVGRMVAEHRRRGDVFQERYVTGPATADGQLTAGPHEELSLPANRAGVLGELEIGNDDPVADAKVVMVGHPVSAAQLAAQNQRATVDIDLETAADGEATVGAQVGVGFVKDRSVAKANAMAFRNEALVDDSVTNRELQDKVTPRGTNYRYGGVGDFMVLVVQAPSSTSESYGLDHTAYDIPIWVSTEPPEAF